MHEYLLHHLKICGVGHDIFDPAAVAAIQQGSGGLFRKANHLARGAIIVAAKNKSMTVIADHVRTASTGKCSNTARSIIEMGLFKEGASGRPISLVI
jgi:hypothetical protein